MARAKKTLTEKETEKTPKKARAKKTTIKKEIKKTPAKEPVERSVEHTVKDITSEDSQKIEELIKEAITYIDTKEWEEMLTKAQAVLNIDPNNGEGYFWSGFAYHMIEDSNKAIDYYQKSIAAKNRFSMSYNNIGVAYRNLKEYDKAIENYDKAIEYNNHSILPYNNKVQDLKNYQITGGITEEECQKQIITTYELGIKNNPLEKILYDNFSAYYKEIKNNKKSTEIMLKYSETIKQRINSTKDDLKNTQEKIGELESLTNTRKMKAIVKSSEEIKGGIERLHGSTNQIHTDITSKQESIQNIYDTIKNQYAYIERERLSAHYQLKADKLKVDLGTLSTYDFEEQKRQITNLTNDSTTPNDDNKNKKSKIQFGFIQYFRNMVILDIAVILIFSFFTPVDNIWFWESIVGNFLRSTPILVLLVWGTRYFNRRIHETVHLIEEYEHKAIVLRSFEHYTKDIQNQFGEDKQALLLYIEKVSNIITDSPTSCLSRKKTDKLPIELIQAITSLTRANDTKV